MNFYNPCLRIEFRMVAGWLSGTSSCNYTGNSPPPPDVLQLRDNFPVSQRYVKETPRGRRKEEKALLSLSLCACHIIRWECSMSIAETDIVWCNF